MSIDTDDLRARLARELDDIGPAGDMAGAAASQGAHVVRRRRVAGGATVALAAAAIAGIAVAGLPGSSDPAPPPRNDVASDTTPSEPEPGWDPLADGHVTRAEWTRAVGETLSAVLPERYGSVAPIDTDFDVQMFGTEGGEPRLQLDLDVSGWHRSEHPVRYQDHTCAAIDAARELYDCSEVSFGDGWHALVETGLLPPGNAGPFEEGERIEIPPYDPDNIPADWTFGTEVHLFNEDVSVRLGYSELGWDEISGNDHPGITDDELLAAVQAPEFLELVGVGVQWWYDAPRPGAGSLVIDAKQQQVPPAVPQ